MSNVKNTDGLKLKAQEKSQKTRDKVDEAIKRLIRLKASINFNSVANEAGVSKPFLYQNKDIRERIETLRKQQEGVRSSKTIKRNMNDENKDALIEILRNKIKNLENENEQLKSELKKYKGQIYDQI